VRRVPGRLSVIALVAGTIFSAISGSTIATTAMLGSLLLPEMLRRGYDRKLAMGPIMAIGGVDMLIPPSSLAVLLGGLSGISISGLLLGGVVPALRFPPGKTLRKALLGLGAALAIGVGEEALFRGVVLRRVRRDAGEAVAVVATTLVYAAVHVIRARGGAGALHAWSGVEQTLGLFAPLASGSALPQVLGLALLGFLLAVARLRSGALWLPIGIHAAWVAVFRVGRLLLDIRPTPAWLVGTGWPPLVGGAAGWIAIGVTAVLLRRRVLFSFKV